MSIELRKKFETVLADYFKTRLFLGANIKVLRSSICIKKTNSINAQGELAWGYLNNANGYFLSVSVESFELKNFFNEIKPPYKSNLLTDKSLFMNTLMEKFKIFATKIGGTVDLPKNEEERSKACEWIYTKVNDIYLPRAMNLIELKPEAIKDIISFPDYYAYPFLTIIYIIKKNNIPLSELDMDSILSKKILGNKSFDKNLLDAYL
ncbi:hypothetical protein [Escherichia coli]|uniref:DUF4304 domain-containing protein n=1 Tax=Escherichia coli TaxID=562 RepID=A0A6D0DQF2_ECOLX|nr:hypothetical protein [Escherichia coli]EFA2318354.1 hypothetical protein [Escherichia coli]EIK3124912.1 hypothetical protein [Escherichia coli]EJV4892599.1 hypothetical protein [Escherichia coli]MBA8192766.1 hypothetical protein [Escherichia coli]MBA8249889.1 hypothetical protein [Escherichia coli]